MATAIFNGFNYRENCVHFLKDTVIEEEQKIKFQAEHDALMGIFNRRSIVEKLKGHTCVTVQNMLSLA